MLVTADLSQVSTTTLRQVHWLASAVWGSDDANSLLLRLVNQNGTLIQSWHNSVLTGYAVLSTPSSDSWVQLEDIVTLRAALENRPTELHPIVSAATLRKTARLYGVRGSELLRVAFVAADTAGAHTIFLEVESDNEAAINLYAKTGFEHFNTYRNYYGPDQDGLAYKFEPLSRRCE